MSKAAVRIPYKSVRQAIGKPVHEFTPNTLPAKPVRGTIEALDLFSGAGGFSTGLARTAAAHGWKVNHTLLNHWSVALDNARYNLGQIRVINGDIGDVDPIEAVPGGYLDILLASPECIFFSSARGAKPINDQRRSTAAEVLRFLEELYVECLVLENVDEIKKWDRLDANGRPIKTNGGEGAYFKAFVKAIKKLGYDVAYQTLAACDFGDPTSRKRFYLIAQRSRRASFPFATHSKHGIMPGTLPWVPARKIINFELKGQSIFSRQEPHVVKTLKRISIGFDDQCERTPLARPYVISVDRFRDVAKLYHDQVAALPSKKKLNRSLTTDERNLVRAVKREAQQQHRLLVEALFREPVATLTWDDLLLNDALQPMLDGEKHDLAVGTLNMLDPVITKLRGTGTTQEISDPLDSTTAGGVTFGIARPTPDVFLVTTNHGDVSVGGDNRAYSLDNPTPTGTTRGSHGVVSTSMEHAGEANDLSEFLPDARILPQHCFSGEPVKTPDELLPSLTCIARHGLVQPAATEVAPVDSFLIGQQSNAAPRSTDEPGPTVAGAGKIALVEGVEPFLTSYYGESGGREHKPRTMRDLVPTQTAENRFALVDGIMNLEIDLTGTIDPVLVSQHFTWNVNPSLDEPAMTSGTRGAGYIAQPELRDVATLVSERNVNPTIVNMKGCSTASQVAEPAPTLTAHARHLYLADGTLSAAARNSEGFNETGIPFELPDAFLTPNFGERETQKPRVHPLSEPAPTATSHGAGMLTQAGLNQIEIGKPYIIVSGHAFSLDVLYRMLESSELARSMSFVTDEHEYRFKPGTSTSSRVKLIGNAVAVKTASALIEHALAHRFTETIAVAA